MVNGFRFIIGNGCNYNCFYCHHEGVFETKPDENFQNKIDIIKSYCDKHKVYYLSITGGEPFLYWEKVKYILDRFNSKQFSFSINTNATLLKNYIDILDTYKCKIELHINVSSLNENTHAKISGSNKFEQMINTLESLKKHNLKICLNTILLKGINQNEVLQFLEYCDKLNYTLRLLQFLPNNIYQKSLVISEKDLPQILPNVEVGEISSYGIFKCKYQNYHFEFVKNLCCDKLCERCKENTYIHFTPELNIKNCMLSSEIIYPDYTNLISFEKIIRGIS